MARKESVVSLPPLSMAALPDLMAREAMLAMTSGRASKMIRRTPIGQEIRSSSKPSSRRVRIVVLLIGSGRSRTSRIPDSISAYFPGRLRSSLLRTL